MPASRGNDHEFPHWRRTVAEIGKEILHWTDTYVLEVMNPADVLDVLMFSLAMDAKKWSRS